MGDEAAITRIGGGLIAARPDLVADRDMPGLISEPGLENPPLALISL